MRENSKKILLFLFPSAGEAVWLTFTQLQRVVPKLSRAGLLSTLFLLDKKDLLRIDKTASEWRYGLSSHGVSRLKALFPALSLINASKQPSWVMLVFLSSPKADQNFRYLRNYLGQNQAVALTRAVYLLPRHLVQQVTPELEKTYKNAVLLVEIGEWLFGDDFKIIGQRAGLVDLFELYSSLSREIDRLTGVKTANKTFTQQENSDFFSALDRFLNLLVQDTALINLYFPEVVSPLNLLGKLQKLLRI
jgi:hypothetical protein